MASFDSGTSVDPRLAAVRHAIAPVRLFALDAGPRELAPPQPCGWAHLVAVRRGSAIVQFGPQRVALTPDVACWVPDRLTYSLELRSRCDLRIAYVDAARNAARPFGALAMNTLLHELMERAVVRGYLDPNVPRDARVLALMHDEIAALPPARSAYGLAYPRDERLRAAIERAQSEESLPTMRELAQSVQLSVRTFERRFIAETGLAPREWLRRARLIAALSTLTRGASVTETAFASGYGSVSAFISAYRALFGVSPGRNVR